MQKIKLAVGARADKTPNQLRRDGRVPATLYGPGQPATSLEFDAREFSRLPAAAYSNIVDLVWSDSGKETVVQAIIRDVQRKATDHRVLNVQFYRVNMDRELTMTVPLKFVGEEDSPAVKEGGKVQVFHQEADVECLPGNIPEFLEVNVAAIAEIDGAIHFSDVKLPANVTLLNPPEDMIVKVVAPKEDKEEAAAAAETEAAEKAEPAAEAASEE